jgi:cellobiose phosphorylase
VTYEITVERSGPGNSVALTADGIPVEGNVIPLPEEGKRLVVVEATLI